MSDEKDKYVIVDYNDVDNKLTIYVNNKPAITMKLNPKAFGIKPTKTTT